MLTLCIQQTSVRQFYSTTAVAWKGVACGRGYF